MRKAVDQTKFNIADSFKFVQKLKDVTVPPDHILISLDVVGLFTCIPFDLLIELIERKWENIEPHTTMNLDIFKEAVNICAKSSYFQYDGKFYIQEIGFPMGSAASLPFSDFMIEDCLESCCEKLPFDIPFIFKYVDDLIACIPRNRAIETLSCFNSYHPNIRFTIEVEKEGKLPYLDTLMMRHDDGSIDTKWYKKPCATGRMISFLSTHPMHQKINTAKNFAVRVANLTTLEDPKWITDTIWKGLRSNDYPISLIKNWTREALRLRAQTQMIVNNLPAADPEGKIYKSMLYVPELTQQIGKIAVKRNPLIVVSGKPIKTTSAIFSQLKDKRELHHRSDVIYSFSCLDCPTTRYYGKTHQLVVQRMKQHQLLNKNWRSAGSCRESPERQKKRSWPRRRP